MTYLVAFLALLSPAVTSLLGLTLGEPAFFTRGLVGNGGSSSSSGRERIVICLGCLGEGCSLMSFTGEGVSGGVVLRGGSLCGRGGVRVRDCFKGGGLLEMCMADIVLRAVDLCGLEEPSIWRGTCACENSHLHVHVHVHVL